MNLQSSEALPGERVERALDDVLARKEFNEEETLFDALIRWLEERLGGVSGGFLEGLVWVVMGACVLLTIWLAVRSFTAHSRRVVHDPGDTVTSASRVERVRGLRQRALEARARGDLHTALRSSLFALILGLGERGDLEYREAWTNRELLERGRPAPEVERLLGGLVEDLERKEYGREEIAAADLDRLEALCESFFGSLGGRDATARADTVVGPVGATNGGAEHGDEGR